MKIIPFYGGFLSNWYSTRFVVRGHSFNCSEQYFMWRKALVFHDEQTAQKILSAVDPGQQKRLGRAVANYKDQKWKQKSRGEMYEANFHKYQQNDYICTSLLATDDDILVEASPVDRVWGVGLSEDDDRVFDRSQWQGSNWLGEVLMKLRGNIRDGVNMNPYKNDEVIVTI